MLESSVRPPQTANLVIDTYLLSIKVYLCLGIFPPLSIGPSIYYTCQALFMVATTILCCHIKIHGNIVL